MVADTSLAKTEDRAVQQAEAATGEVVFCVVLLRVTPLLGLNAIGARICGALLHLDWYGGMRG